MRRRFRPPMLAVAFVLLGLIALLAILQYRWLGQISEAERERLRSTLSTAASEFAMDFDRELTRAYLLFQIAPGSNDELSSRLAERYDQWHATSRFPRLLKEIYVLSHEASGTPALRRFDTAARRVGPGEWPASMADWRAHFGEREAAHDDGRNRTRVITRISQPIWEQVPAIVAPMPLAAMFRTDRTAGSYAAPMFSYAILVLDLDYLSAELLPALAGRHFGRSGSDLDFQVAVIRNAGDGGLVYTSSPSFAPVRGGPADATADLFQVRTQEFTTMAAEVRRFMSFSASLHDPPPGRDPSRQPGSTGPDVMTFRESHPISIVVQPGPAAGSLNAAATARFTTMTSPKWTLVLEHPAGSLEAAVGALRRRNLLVSSSILGVLGASMGLLVLSTRRAQRLARQQMEFVAAVSHELRTPLAVIRSAAENLADGVVAGDGQVRQYGELMRNEGRRLTGMVEQILELAGIHSGQREFALRAVALKPLLDDVIASSSSLIERAGLEVEVHVPEDLPPVLADEAALRRVFQNLVGNAIKYGEDGGWIGLSAARVGPEIRVTVADRGMGIAASEQSRIFEPFYRAPEAVAAQIQGAGLGLSLVQRIVESHGGRVSVRSTPGGGSEFTVRLPAAGGKPVARAVAAAQPASS